MLKKRFVRIAAMVMAASLCLCACGKESDEKSETESTGVFESLSENTDTGSITVVSHGVECLIDEKKRAQGNYPEIILPEEMSSQYPRLSERISELNELWKNEIRDYVAEYANWAVESTYLEDPVFESEISLEIIRVDDRLFTLFMSYYDDAGGAHPSHGNYTYNIDPVTGKDINIQDVLADSSDFASSVRKEIQENYADYDGLMEQIDEYYFRDDDEDPDVFQQKLYDESYTWYIDDQGLNICFSPYEIAPYAMGYLDATLSYEEYPNLIQEAYKVDDLSYMEELVTTSEADTEYVDAKEEQPLPVTVTLNNPSWDRYTRDAQSVEINQISLTLAKEDKSDYLDTWAWQEEHGFSNPNLNHEDSNYFYYPYYSLEYDNMYQCLSIYDTEMENMYYDFDFSLLCNGPDEEVGKVSDTEQFIRYATIVDNILYAELGHWGYASEESKSSYIVAIDLDTNEIIFKSEALIANADNFLIFGDTIICGYGFTSEPDHIYLLNRFTGEKYNTIPVNSAPYQFEIVDDTLYVATYNTAYEFKIGS